MNVDPSRDQKRPGDPMGLERQTVLSCLSWVLGTELRTWARAEHALNHRAVSPAH